MQCLAVSDKLKLARCSRRLYADADSAAAWLHAPLISLRCGSDGWYWSTPRGSFKFSSHATLLRALVARNAALRVEWSAPGTAAGFHALLQLPRVRELRVNNGAPLSVEQWTALLSSPLIIASLGSLRLRLFGLHELPSNFIALLAAMPKLHTFSHAWKPAHWTWAGLSDCRSLTQLSAIDSNSHLLEHNGELLQHMPPPDSTQRFKLIEIVEPNLFGSDFRAFFCTPTMSHLRHLCLSSFTPSSRTNASASCDIPAVDAEAVFRHLQSLEHLELHWVICIDWLLSHAKHARSLQQLEFTCSDTAVPTTAVLAQLMVALPRLTIDFPSHLVRHVVFQAQLKAAKAAIVASEAAAGEHAQLALQM